MTSPEIVALDIGGSGARLGFDVDDFGQRVVDLPPLRVGPSGPRVVEAVTSALQALDAQQLTLAPQAVVVAASGIIAAGDAVALETLAILRRKWPSAALMLLSDAVAALVASVGVGGGVCVAAGTGVVGLGSDLHALWHRVDGWGMFLGDEGGGAWIGQAGLRAAFRALDGRRHGSEPLLHLADAHYGHLEDLPRRLGGSEDRAALLAQFAPAVARAAREGDPVAGRVWEQAGTLLGHTAIACMQPDMPPRVAICGGLVAAEDLLAPSLVSTVQRALDVTPNFTDAPILSGATHLGHTLIRDPNLVSHHPPLLRKDLP